MNPASADAPSPSDLLSPRQAAAALGVSESSLKRWCDQGMIPSLVTPGGHRRLPLAGILEFAQKSQHSFVRPELLGLAAVAGQQRFSWEAAVDSLVAALVSGNESAARQIVMDAFLRGSTIAEIGDLLCAPALHQVGERWQCGELEIYRERRSCRIMLRIMLEVRALLPPPHADQPIAIGGTFEGDFYDLPTTLVEMVLIQAGWNASSLGASLPATTMISALREYKPKLFWVSVSSAEDEAALQTWVYELAAAAHSCGTRLILGGRAFVADRIGELESAVYYPNLAELAAAETVSGSASTDA